MLRTSDSKSNEQEIKGGDCVGVRNENTGIYKVYEPVRTHNETPFSFIVLEIA